MPAGALQFVADTSQFSGEMERASKSTLNVAASAEEARQRIVASYQQQVKAAHDLGASQTQLASIANRASSQLASVTEDNARRYINAVDRMEDRTRRFNAARQAISSATITTPTSSFDLGGYAAETNAAKALSGAVDGVSAAHGRGASSAVQFGSVMRGLEGNFSRNIRAAEAFGSSLSFLGPLVEVAFPIVGAAALGYALVEMSKHAYEAWQNIVNLRSAIEGLNQLQIKVDSDHGRAGDQQESAVESILERTQGRAAAATQKYSYQSQQPLDLSSYFYSDQFKKLPNDVKGTFEATYKNVAPADAQAKIQQITKTVNELTAALDGVKNHTIGAFLPVINGSGPGASRDPAAYYQAQLTAAKQIQTGLTDASGTRSANLQVDQTDIVTGQAEDQQKAAQAAQAAGRKAAEARRQAAAEMAKSWEVDLKNWELAQEYAKNISNFTSEYMNEAIKSQGLSPDDQKSLSQHGSADAARITALSQGLALTQQNADALAQFSIQMALSTGQISKMDAAQATAALHRQQYTDAMEKLQAQSASIASDHRYDQNETARTAAQLDNQNQQSGLTAKYSIQLAQDNQSANPASSSASVGFANAINDFVAASQDAASQMKELTSNTLQGLNQQIVAAMSGQRTNFSNFGAGVFRNVSSIGLQKSEGSALSLFGGKSGKLGSNKGNPMFVQVVGADGIRQFGSGSGGYAGGVFGSGGSGSSGSTNGFFGAVNKAFGTSFGSSVSGPGYDGLDAAQGISMNAGSVAVDDTDSFAGMLDGALAVGGPADSNSSYLVGERGPEILSMGSQSGRVIPSSKIGGSSGHTFNIDASGSTDPAQTRVQVMRGIQAAAPHISANAINAQSEQRRRKPSSAR